MPRTTLTSEVVEAALRDYPLPIADAVGALVSSMSPHEERDRVVECFRTVLRFTSVLVVASAAQRGRKDTSSEVDELLATLPRRSLTDGQWHALSRGLARGWQASPSSHPIPLLVELFGDNQYLACVDGLLAMRRRETVAHGSTGDASEIEEILSRRVPQLEAVLRALSPLWKAFTLVAPLAHPEDIAARQPAWRLVGDTPARGRWRRIDLGPGVRLPPRELVLVDGDLMPRVALEPIALLRKPSPDAPEELFALDGAHKAMATYVAFPSQSEHRASGVWERLRSAFDTSAEIDREEATTATRPFRGLQSFDADQARLFFGRDELAETLVNRVRREVMVTVTGPSGAGKTSLLHAGVLPRLLEFVPVKVRPGADPPAALAARLLTLQAWADPTAIADAIWRAPDRFGTVLAQYRREHGHGLVLVIDQLEEVFTLCEDDELRDQFARCLASAVADAEGRIRVVLSVREDFFGRLATLAPLHAIYARQVEVVQPLDRAGLIDALVKPLELFGFAVEDALLVEALVGPLVGKPAAPAILQFTADRLWELRDRTWKRLTWDAYRSIGGVEGALARHADTTLAKLPPSQQTIARAVLLRLVTAERTRGVVRRDAFGDTSAIVEHLASARLLTIRDDDDGHALVELAHEALIANWTQLRTWLDEDHEFLKVRGRLSVAARRWVGESRGHDFLLGDGRPVLEAAHVLATHRSELNALETEFVLASVVRARRKRLLRRGGTALVGALAIVAFISAYIALRQSNKTRDALATLESVRVKEATQANAAAIAQARGVILRDPTAAIAILQRMNVVGGGWDEARLVAMEAIRRGVARRVLPGTKHGVEAIAWSPDGSLVAASDLSSQVRVWNVKTGVATVVTVPFKGVDAFAFAPVGHRLAIGGEDRRVAIWDPETGSVSLHGKPGTSCSGESCGFEEKVMTLAFTHDAASILVARLNGASVIDLADGDKERVIANGYRIAKAAWALDETKVVAVVWRQGSDSSSLIWDVRTGNTTLLPGVAGWDLEVSADGKTAYAGYVPPGSGTKAGKSEEEAGELHIEGNLDVASDDVAAIDIAEATITPLRMPTGTPFDLALARDGRLAVLSRDGTIDIVDPVARVVASRTHAVMPDPVHLATNLDTRLEVSPFPPDGSISFSPNGRHLAAVTKDAVHIWTAANKDDARILVGHAGRPRRARYASDGTLATSANDGTIRVWDEPDIVQDWTPLSPRISHDGRVMASLGWDHSIRIWNIDTGERRLVRAPDEVLNLELSEDGTTMAWMTRKHGVYVSSTREDTPHRIGDATAEPNGDVEIARDGGVAWVQSGATYLWDGAIARALTGPQDCGDLVFSDDGRLLVCGTNSGRAFAWRGPTWTGAEIGRVDGKLGSMKVSPDATWIAGSVTDAVHLWGPNGVHRELRGVGGSGQWLVGLRYLVRAKTGAWIAISAESGDSAELIPAAEAVSGVATNNAGTTLASIVMQGRVLLRDATRGTKVDDLLAFAQVREHLPSEYGRDWEGITLASVAVSNDGGTVLVANWWGDVWAWHLSDRRMHHYRPVEPSIEGVSLAPDGAHAVIRAGGNHLRTFVVDVATGAHRKLDQTQTPYVFSPSGDRVGVKQIAGCSTSLSGCRIGMMSIDFASGNTTEVATAAAYALGTSGLAYAESNGKLVWRPAHGGPTETLLPGDGVNGYGSCHLALSEDERFVVAGCGDGIHVIELATKHDVVMSGQANALSPRLAPDAKLVVGNDDDNCRVWDVATRHSSTIPRCTAGIAPVAFSPTGDGLYYRPRERPWQSHFVAIPTGTPEQLSSQLKALTTVRLEDLELERKTMVP